MAEYDADEANALLAELLVRFEEVDASPTKYRVDYDRLFVADFPVA